MSATQERRAMTAEDKLKRWELKLADAQKEQMRQAQWIGERLGAIAATREAERKVRRIVFQIEKLRFAEHLLGNCDASTCSDCRTNRYAPDEWPARGSNLKTETPMSSDSSKPRNDEKVGDLVRRNKELYMKGPIVLFRVEGDSVVYYFDHEMPPKRYRCDIATEQEKLMWDAIKRKERP